MHKYWLLRRQWQFVKYAWPIPSRKIYKTPWEPLTIEALILGTCNLASGSPVMSGSHPSNKIGREKNFVAPSKQYYNNVYNISFFFKAAESNKKGPGGEYDFIVNPFMSWCSSKSVFSVFHDLLYKRTIKKNIYDRSSITYGCTLRGS